MKLLLTFACLSAATASSALVTTDPIPPDSYFTEADPMPKCFIGKDLHTYVHYSADHPQHTNFLCTHNADYTACTCTSHPNKQTHATCKQFNHHDGTTHTVSGNDSCPSGDGTSSTPSTPSTTGCISTFVNGDWHNVQFNDFTNNAGDIKPLMSGACRVHNGKYCCKSTLGNSGNPHGQTYCYDGSLNFWGRVFRLQTTPTYETCKFCSLSEDCFSTVAPAGQCQSTFVNGDWHNVQFNDFTNNAGDIKPLMSGACRVHNGKYCCKSTLGNSGNPHGQTYCYDGSLNFWGRVFRLQDPTPTTCSFCSLSGDCFHW